MSIKDAISLDMNICSAPTLSTFKNMLKTHLFSRSYFTDKLFCRAANIVPRPCSDSSHVTAPYKLSFYYYLLVDAKRLTVKSSGCIDCVAKLSDAVAALGSNLQPSNHPTP